jgi:protein pelota
MRKKYVNLVNSVKGSGGTVHIFSSMHASGEREYHFYLLKGIA